MTSETTGIWLLVAGLVLGCGSWIAAGVVRLWARKDRLYKAWRAAARGNPYG
jgi:hypothetical protein